MLGGQCVDIPLTGIWQEIFASVCNVEVLHRYLTMLGLEKDWGLLLANPTADTRETVAFSVQVQPLVKSWHVSY